MCEDCNLANAINTKQLYNLLVIEFNWKCLGYPMCSEKHCISVNKTEETMSEELREIQT